MTWDYFGWIVLASSLCWAAGALIAWKETSHPLAVGITASGILLFFLSIIGLWIIRIKAPLMGCVKLFIKCQHKFCTDFTMGRDAFYHLLT